MDFDVLPDQTRYVFINAWKRIPPRGQNLGFNRRTLLGLP